MNEVFGATREIEVGIGHLTSHIGSERSIEATSSSSLGEDLDHTVGSIRSIDCCCCTSWDELNTFDVLHRNVAH